MKNSGKNGPVLHLSWPQAMLILGAIVIFFAIDTGLYVWLAGETHWPRSYGIECRRRCLYAYLVNSPRLVMHGGLAEFMLFCVLWAGPLVVLIFSLFVRRKVKRHRQAKTTT